MKAYMIMDFNNPVSVEYSKKSIESFKCVEDIIEIIPTQCVVPSDLKWIDKKDQWGVGPTLNKSVCGMELVYWPHHVLRSGNRDWTDKEKSCFASHCKLWMQQYESEERFIILEHDAYLTNESKFRKDYERMNKYGLWMPGIAVECYSLSTNLSKWIYLMMTKYKWNTIAGGPMGYLHKITREWKTLIPQDGRKNKLTDGTEAPVTQLYSKSLGITLDHILDTKYEEMPNLFVID